jgi:hypothetical protein
MRLFLEHFGLLIGVAFVAVWGIFLTVRYPLKGRNESPIAYLSRFCEKYEGRPCMQMKIFLRVCFFGALCAAAFTVVFTRH